MSTYIKLISLICGAGIGLGGGIPLAIKALQVSSNNTGIKEGQAVVSSSASSAPSNSVGQSIRTGDREASEIQKQRAKSREQGNCVVLDDSDEIKDIIQTFHLQEDDYTAVSCKSTHTKGAIIFSNWRGILPTDLLTNGWLLKEGDRFNITTETKTVEVGDYQIIFDGDRIETPISGEWEDSLLTTGGKSVSVVKVLGSEKSQESIYLLLEDNSR